LFHRRDATTGHGILRLKRYLNQEGALDGRGELYYALARAIAASSDNGKIRKRDKQTIDGLLNASLRDGAASPFQMSRREALLASL